MSTASTPRPASAKRRKHTKDFKEAAVRLAQRTDVGFARAANAAMESFWHTLKNELIHRHHYQTRDEAQRAIFEYIEVFYNRIRRHSSIGYLSPEAFELQRPRAA